MGKQSVFEMAYKMSAKLDKSYNKTFKNAEKIADSTFGKISKLAVKGLGVAGGAMILKDSANSFIEFEKGMGEVFTLIPEASREAMDKMSNDVLAFSDKMGILTDEATPALYSALSAGVAQDNVFEFLEDATKASIGGVTDMNTAVDGITTVMNSYGSEIINSAKASDIMFTAVKKGKTTFGELSASMSNVLPSASATGVAFEQVSAMISTMTAQGVPTSVATTKIRSMLDELSKSGTKTSKVFEKVAGVSFKSFVDSGGDVQQALQLLEKHAKGTGLGINDLFSSMEAGSSALLLTGNATEKFSEDLEAMYNSIGATDTAFEEIDRTLGRQLERIKVKLDVFKKKTGKVLGGAVKTFLDFGSDIKSAFDDSTFGKIFNVFVGQAGAFGDSIKALFNGGMFRTEFTKAINGLKEPLGEAFGGVLGDVKFVKIEGVLQNTMQVLLDFRDGAKSAFGIVKKVVVGTFDVISDTLSKNNEKMQGILGRMFDSTETSGLDSIINVISKLGDGILWVAGVVIPPFINEIVGVIDITTKVASKLKELGLVEPIIYGIVAAFGAVKFIEFAKGAGKVFVGVKKMITGFSLLSNPIGLVVVGVGLLVAAGVLLYKNWDKIKAKGVELVDSFKNKFPTLFEIAKNTFEGISQYIGTVRDVFDGIINFVGGVFSGDWERAWSGIKQIFIGVFEGLAILLSIPIQNALIVFDNMKQGVENKFVNMKDSVISSVGDMMNAFSERFPVMYSVVMQYVDAIKGYIDGVKLAFSGVIEFISGVFTGDWERVWSGIVNIFGGIFGSISSLAKAPMNAIIVLVNSMIDKVNEVGFEIPNWIPSFGGQTFSMDIAHIPQFATGSNYTPSTFIAGEKGAELITDRAGSKVFTALQTDNVLRNLQTVSSGENSDRTVNTVNRNNSNTNSDIVITYSPVININGGNGSDAVDFESVLKKNILELERMIERIIQSKKDRKVRLSNA